MRIKRLIIPGLLVGALTALGAGGASSQDASPAPAASLPPAEGPASALTYQSPTQFIHAMPTVPLANQIRSGQAGGKDLVYHSGGLIMKSAKVFTIFWEPAKMQNGEKTVPFSAKYMQRQNAMFGLYDGHGLADNNTQYYQVVNGKKTKITNNGGFGGTYVDKDKFPAAGCSDSQTPGNCLSDAQLQKEIDKIVSLKKWPRTFETMFFIYTPKNMGSCYNGSQCAYKVFCAYHSAFGNFQKPTIYANEPYGDPNVCWDGGPSPSGDIATDSALDTSSHELTEAITDPLGNAWFNKKYGEIGDICNFTFGTDRFDGGKANQHWGNQFFRLQEEYDNHKSACVQAGP